jgi:quercetin dioxygenase-like cupin family protein
MELIDCERDAVNLLATPLHLGLGSRARAMQDFAWTPEVLEAYTAAAAADGAEGRMVIVIDDEGPGDHWERHPHGDEVVVCLTGRVTVTHESATTVEEVHLGPGEAAVNPAGVWHAVDMHGQGRILTITPGIGTEHRSREG